MSVDETPKNPKRKKPDAPSASGVDSTVKGKRSHIAGVISPPVEMIEVSLDRVPIDIIESVIREGETQLALVKSQLSNKTRKTFMERIKATQLPGFPHISRTFSLNDAGQILCLFDFQIPEKIFETETLGDQVLEKKSDQQRIVHTHTIQVDDIHKAQESIEKLSIWSRDVTRRHGPMGACDPWWNHQLTHYVRNYGKEIGREGISEIQDNYGLAGGFAFLLESGLFSYKGIIATDVIEGKRLFIIHPKSIAGNIITVLNKYDRNFSFSGSIQSNFDLKTYAEIFDFIKYARFVGGIDARGPIDLDTYDKSIKFTDTNQIRSVDDIICQVLAGDARKYIIDNGIITHRKSKMQFRLNELGEAFVLSPVASKTSHDDAQVQSTRDEILTDIGLAYGWFDAPEPAGQEYPEIESDPESVPGVGVISDHVSEVASSNMPESAPPIDILSQILNGMSREEIEQFSGHGVTVLRHADMDASSYANKVLDWGEPYSVIQDDKRAVWGYGEEERTVWIADYGDREITYGPEEFGDYTLFGVESDEATSADSYDLAILLKANERS